MTWPYGTRRKAGAPDTVELSSAMWDTLLAPLQIPTGLVPLILGYITTNTIDTTAMCAVEAPPWETWTLSDLTDFFGDNVEAAQAKMLRMMWAQQWPTYCEFVPAPADAVPTPVVPGPYDGPPVSVGTGYDYSADLAGIAAQLTDMMAKVWETWAATGSTVTAGTAYGSTLRDTYTNVRDVQSMLQGVDTNVRAAQVSLATLYTAVQDAKNALTTSISDALNNLTVRFNTVDTADTTMAAALAALGTNVSAYRDAILAAIADALSTLQTRFTTVDTADTTILAVLNPFKTQWDQFWIRWPDLQAMLTGWSAFYTAWQDLYANYVVNIRDAILNNVSLYRDAILAAIADAYQLLETDMTTRFNTVDTADSAAASVLANMQLVLAAIRQQDVPAIENLIGNIPPTNLSPVQTQITALSSAVTAARDWLSGRFDTRFDTVDTADNAAASVLANVFGELTAVHNQDVPAIENLIANIPAATPATDLSGIQATLDAISLAETAAAVILSNVQTVVATIHQSDVADIEAAIANIPATDLSTVLTDLDAITLAITGARDTLNTRIDTAESDILAAITGGAGGPGTDLSVVLARLDACKTELDQILAALSQIPRGAQYT